MSAIINEIVSLFRDHVDECVRAAEPNCALTEIDLDELIQRFVALHAAAPKQRSPGWYIMMGLTIGGSDLSATLGDDHYKTAREVVQAKIRMLKSGEAPPLRGGGLVACCWGVIFEDVLANYIEADLDTDVEGDEISVRDEVKHPGVRYSPDGFLKVALYRGADGTLRLWTSDLDRRAIVAYVIALLESKCPLSRLPDGKVPRQYRPQVRLGLACAPIANFGLFADAIFRKCSLGALGPTGAFDREYHNTRSSEGLEKCTPRAFGTIRVYAPRMSAPRPVRLGWRGAEWAPGDPESDIGDPDADAAVVAWQIARNYFGPAGVMEPVDLGDVPPATFDRVLGMISRGMFRTEIASMTFTDGRFSTDFVGPAFVEPGVSVPGVVGGPTKKPPLQWWLAAILPWKLFNVEYSIVERSPGFLDEILPRVSTVLAAVSGAAAAADPDAWLAANAPEFAAPSGLRVAGASATVGADAIQDLFDLLGSARPCGAAPSPRT